MFGSNEIFAPDEAGLEFLFSPHGVWSGDSMFPQTNCIPEIIEPMPFSPYDTPITYNHDTFRTAQSVPRPMEDSRPCVVAGQKRKRSSTSKAPSKKQPRMENSPRCGPREGSGDAPCNPPSTRAHYAVEKRYRSTLNDRYATLARLVSQPETQEICRTICKDWEVPSKLDSSTCSGKDKDPTKRQSKTTTLSVAIETIATLDQCCTQKAKELQFLLQRLKGIAHSVPATSDGRPGLTETLR
ncbi:helix-loop-helix DNA-binding domain-containing [Lecanosticta acicola]|uniref:Helix-loop-helix DNA-binding domain-containing n=1 Tax=Lecanosticta acicola TaxID=111012 RepID=A0AAI8Z4L5_9PEZI|nr:helix-loop-helix DNA-binding domain-containing [Lecanosticta acicola]